MKKTSNGDLESLNKELPPFFLEDLEQRLETDPLAVGGLIDLESDADSDFCISYSVCKEDVYCKGNESCSVHW